MAEAANVDQPQEADKNIEIMIPINFDGQRHQAYQLETICRDIWEQAIENFYQNYHLEKHQNTNATQINIFTQTELKERILDINIYTNGTIMFQGREIDTVPDTYKTLRRLVDQIKNERARKKNGPGNMAQIDIPEENDRAEQQGDPGNMAEIDIIEFIDSLEI